MERRNGGHYIHLRMMKADAERTERTPLSRVVALTATALTCFAGNSLLCRLALAEKAIDATSFTFVRIVSGAIVLFFLARPRLIAAAAAAATAAAAAATAAGAKSDEPERPTESARWISSAALFAYAAPFSYAYLKLGAAIGALVLFASVQATMIGWGIVRGERPSLVSWVGILIALGGLIALTVPGKSAPDPVGAAAMAFAGIAWGVYSLRGRLAKGDPVALTSASFTRSVAFAAILLLVAIAAMFPLHASPRGILLATASGAIASGVGYSIWYAALRHLTATRAAILQLLVPILAAALAVVLLGETLSIRLLLASSLILGGVAITIRGKAG
jgi:drug/metabolite transporter (DMT)-like permease